ncbi:MAG: peptidoglycan editing factor PgeF [Clostridia bacterium]|nr:peptidoglycan editing factor PgeF [Clostridia bacterium]
MTWTLHQNGGEYLTCPLLDGAGVPHLFSTRWGGVSAGCFSDWNFASGTEDVKDDPEHVLENYERAARIFGLRKEDVCRTYQAHTDRVLTVGEPERGVGISKPKFPFGVDGLVTASPDLLLSVRTADCVPILLADPYAGVCAAVHAGWRGTAAGIAAVAVGEMGRSGADPARILAALGPCAGPDCYEVGEDVRQAFALSFPGSDPFFRPKDPEAGSGDPKYLLDMAGANRARLIRAGLTEDHISVCGLCTHCRTDLFFSHRAMGIRRGTMSAFICVPSGGKGVLT